MPFSHHVHAFLQNCTALVVCRHDLFCCHATLRSRNCHHVHPNNNNFIIFHVHIDAAGRGNQDIKALLAMDQGICVNPAYLATCLPQEQEALEKGGLLSNNHAPRHRVNCPCIPGHSWSGMVLVCSWCLSTCVWCGCPATWVVLCMLKVDASMVLGMIA